MFGDPYLYTDSNHYILSRKVVCGVGWTIKVENPISGMEYYQRELSLFLLDPSLDLNEGFELGETIVFHTMNEFQYRPTPKFYINDILKPNKWGKYIYRNNTLFFIDSNTKKIIEEHEDMTLEEAAQYIKEMNP